MNNKGFTLIEVSIGITILSLLALGWIAAYNAYIQKAKVQTIKIAFIETQSAIKEWSLIQSPPRYPKPADLFLPSTNSDSGKEIDAITLGTIENCGPGWPATAGSPGVCLVDRGTPLNLDDDILIGAVPFTTLGLNKKEAYDFYGRKILYAVTRSQATAYTKNFGQIITESRVSNFTTLSYDLETETLIDMVLVSMGQNGEGAYLEDGTLMAPCFPAGGAVGDELENENCNNDHFFYMRSEYSSEATGLNYLDDYTHQQDQIDIGTWAQSLIEDQYLVTKASKLGIGTEEPNFDIHVVGDITSDKLLAERVCRSTGAADCFEPRMIAETLQKMNCRHATPNDGRDKALTEINNTRVICAMPAISAAARTAIDTDQGTPFELPTASFQARECVTETPFKMMAGIDSLGNPICIEP